MFFGYEHGIEMSYFSIWHLVQILVTAVVIFLIIRFKDQLREYKHEKRIRYIAGILLILLEISWHAWSIYNGKWTVVKAVPLGVCAINIYFAIYLLFTKNEKVFNIIYFWGLGAILSVVFPDISHGPDRFRYYEFFLIHQMFLWTYMYLIFVHGYRPQIKHMLRSALALFIAAVGIALPLSFIFEHNFMFMYDAGGTPLEIIQPLGHAVYVIGTVIVMFIVMSLYYSPIYFFVIRKENKQEAS